MDTSELLKIIRKKYTDEAVFTLDDFASEKVDGISTGYLDIDIKSGIGGVPRGRVVEIFGPEQSGKSTLCSSIIATSQQSGLICGYIDTESSLDLSFASKIGVQPDKLIISQPDDLDTALGVAEEFVRSEYINVVIFDSLVGLGTAKEAEDDFGKANYGGTKLNYQWFRRNMPYIRDNKVAVVFTNQIRDKIGAFLPTFDTAGGHALKHYASMRIQTSRISNKDIKIGDEVIGVTCTALFKKNKVAPPFKVSEFAIYFDRGVWKAADTLDNCLKCGIMSMRGAYVVYNGETIAQGKQAAAEALEANPEFMERLRLECLQS